MLRDRLGVSERWACKVVGQHRSTHRHEPKRAADDAALRAELRKFSKERPRWGYRRAHHRLRELGWEVNRKRVQRLWREEGLRVPQRKRKRRRLGESTVPAQRLRAERPNQVWAIDFQFDQTADGRVLKLLNVVDEFTREALAMLVQRSIDADRTVERARASGCRTWGPGARSGRFCSREQNHSSVPVSVMCPGRCSRRWSGRLRGSQWSGRAHNDQSDASQFITVSSVLQIGVVRDPSEASNGSVARSAASLVLVLISA